MATQQEKPVRSNMEPMFYRGTVPGHMVGESGQVPYEMLTYCIDVPLHATLLIEGRYFIEKEILPAGKYVIVKRGYDDELVDNGGDKNGAKRLLSG